MIRDVVYGAISLAAISSIASAEDLSTATTPLPPGAFTTSAHSDEWKVANALSAGPASITEHAAVIDWPANPKDGMSHGRVLRQGTNGWTCMPDVPGRPQHDPMCDAFRGINQDISNNQPYTTLLSSADVATPLWVIPIARGGERIKEEAAK